jgi:hypothetical protein
MWFILALSLQFATIPGPCGPSLVCPVQALAAQQQVPSVGVTADPASPAKWFIASNLAAVGAFDTWALATGHNTISQFAQHESRAHAGVRWSIVVAGAMLIWHLAWGFPW